MVSVETHFASRIHKGESKNIHAHYDIGNNFYELWLDKTWTYSSAIFAGDFTKSLEQAQSDKYQRIIDQLGLKPVIVSLRLAVVGVDLRHMQRRQGYM